MSQGSPDPHEHEFPLEGLFAPDRAARADLEQKLADATAALEDAEQRHRVAIAETADQLAALRAQYDIAMARSAATWDMVDEQLRAAALEVERARQSQAAAVADVDRLLQRESELSSRLEEASSSYSTLERRLGDAEQRHASEVEHFTTRERELSSTVADLTTSRDDLARRLTATEAAFEDASTRATRERLTATRRAAEREAELDGQLQHARAAHARLEQTIADAEAALRDAQQRHEAALATAANRLAERQAHFERALSETTADRDRVAQRLSDAEAALDQSRRDHQSSSAAVERLTQRESDLTSQLAGGQAARHTLEIQLADAAAAISGAAAREAELDEQIRQERATRATLEQTIADAEAALRDAQQRHEAALATAANQLAERQAHFERALSETTADRDRVARRLSDAEAALDQSRRDHQSSTAAVERLTQRESDLTSQLAGGQAARHTLEIQLADAARERARELAAQMALQQALTDTRAAALETEHSLREEIEALRAQTLEQASRFEVQIAQERLERESLVADMQDSHRALTLERDALQQSLTAVRAQSQQQLDESRAELQRLFEQTGLAMFRCTRDGALIHANRACTTLVGRRTLDELRGAHFAAAVFEAPDALSWLIERCQTTRSKESIETTWRRHDGGRLFVRVSARLSTPDVIEMVAEDLTRLRVLEERLGQAHRMEAVGRFASDVAGTCSNLLNDIHQKGAEWLETMNHSADARQHGQRFIDEVGRAAGLIRQLAACSEEQARTPMLVDLNTLIRDLEPVLKRVSGGDVEIQLRDASSPLNVEAQIEQVERLFVNVAGNGRARMPLGGRLRIELGTTVVDRHFAAKHPNVRLGLHALITVTEIKRAARADRGNPRRERPAPSVNGRVAPTVGVDLGTLQELVSECGGHLWMKVQPPGDMVVTIRLPLSSVPDQMAHRTVATRGGRVRSARWFQS